MNPNQIGGINVPTFIHRSTMSASTFTFILMYLFFM